jgi:hypothetical protein
MKRDGRPSLPALMSEVVDFDQAEAKAIIESRE